MDHGQVFLPERLIRNRSKHPHDACSPGLPPLPSPVGQTVRLPVPAPSLFMGEQRSEGGQGITGHSGLSGNGQHVGKGTCGFSVKMQRGLLARSQAHRLYGTAPPAICHGRGTRSCQ